MVWGVGQVLLEGSTLDPRIGQWLTNNLGEALVPTHADIATPTLSCDTRGPPLGVKGLAEIGGVGTAAAIANAVFHATGQRLTTLFMRMEQLLPYATKLF